MGAMISMSRYRTVSLLMGSVAVMLLYPAIYVFEFYFATQKFLASTPRIEANLGVASSDMRSKRLSCKRAPAGGAEITPRDICMLYGDIHDAKHRFNVGLTDNVYDVLERRCDVTTGVENLTRAWGDMAEYLNSIEPFGELCHMPVELTWEDEAEAEAARKPEELARIEREGQQKMLAHAAKLEEFRQMFVRAREAHEARKVRFNAIVWAWMVFEAIGLCCVVDNLRWIWRRRRDQDDVAG